MATLVEALGEFCQTQGFDKTYWVAFSGGLDSQVLLHVLVTLRSHYPLKLSAVYINHGLSPNAEKWALHCKSTCEKMQIDFHEKKVNAKNAMGESPEEAARDARYQAFKGFLSTDDILLTAHHQDDQAETVLLQLLRGAGPKGLSAMPFMKPFAGGWHGRPLLSFSRTELKEYAEQYELKWIEDESNFNTNLTRNFIRHDVMSLLKKRWPAIEKTLSRTAAHCSEVEALLDEVIQQDLISVQQGETLSVKKLLDLSVVRQRHVLRAWLKQLNFPIPSAVKMHQIQHDMLHAREDKMPCVFWGNVELRRYRAQLFAQVKLEPHDVKREFQWDLNEDLLIPGVGVLKVQDFLELKKITDHVTVRFRQGGERCRLPGQAHHRELKKLFQEWGVLPWMRDRVPLLYVGDRLVEIAKFP